MAGTEFDCSLDPDISPEFLADQAATDIILLTLGDWNNCFSGNTPLNFTFFSTLGVLSPCAP